jgi:hypothetical protein
MVKPIATEATTAAAAQSPDIACSNRQHSLRSALRIITFRRAVASKIQVRCLWPSFLTQAKATGPIRLRRFHGDPITADRPPLAPAPFTAECIVGHELLQVRISRRNAGGGDELALHFQGRDSQFQFEQLGGAGLLWLK